MRSCTIVDSSWMLIWKPPSPQTAHTVASGRAILAPMADGQAEAHRAQAAGADPAVALVAIEELRRPHLVLAHVGRDDDRRRRLLVDLLQRDAPARSSGACR